MGNCCCGVYKVKHHHTPETTKIIIPEKPADNRSKPDQITSPARNKSIHRTGEDCILPEPRATGSGSNHQNEGAGKVITLTPLLRIYTLTEMKSATNNFRPDTVLGQGGFGTVFKGWVDERTLAPTKVGVGIPVAVKRSDPDSEQGLQEWQSEVKFLGRCSHPNLVRLFGYCWEDKQFLLVYEYMQKGSLENHLFNNVPDPLPWDVRLKIAIGAARGLDYLHTSEKSVIYRDFKSSNILLDGSYNSKLSDFGLAKLGPVNGNSHVTTRIMGTYGYAAPEYVATGHLYVRSDVYGFGVVLLEILTGLPTFDPKRPSGQNSLVEWASPALADKRKIKRIMDPKLEGQYPIKGALQTGELILKCLEEDPKNRPAMDEVLATLEAINSIKKPKNTKPSAAPPSRKTRDAASSSSASHDGHYNHQRSPIHHHPPGGHVSKEARAHRHASKPTRR